MTSKANLEHEVSRIFTFEWNEREGRDVPNPWDLSPDNDAITLNATVLYADMADSTDLVDHYSQEPNFAAEIYKAYLRCAASIINNEQGTITAYDGDRVMAVFLDNIRDNSQTLAVRSAMKINYAVREIINPLLGSHYPNKRYRLKHVIGIDTSELFVARTGVRRDSDLVWVGRAANYAAKLCSMDEKYSIYITKAVFEVMDDDVKYSGKDNLLVWGKMRWRARNNMTIYGSNWFMSIN